MRPLDEDKTHPPGCAGCALFILVAVAAMLVGLVFFFAHRAEAAVPGYCQLWSRAIAELEVQAGTQLELIFAGNELIFARKEDADIATADGNLVEIRASSHYHSCLALDEYDVLPLPDVAQAQTANWAHRVALGAVGRQGIAPAAADPTPSPTGDAAWREACDSKYRTWDADTGTVVRRGSPERVRCPLALVDGEWRIP